MIGLRQAIELLGNRRASSSDAGTIIENGKPVHIGAVDVAQSRGVVAVRIAQTSDVNGMKMVTHDTMVLSLEAARDLYEKLEVACEDAEKYYNEN